MLGDFNTIYQHGSTPYHVRDLMLQSSAWRAIGRKDPEFIEAIAESVEKWSIDLGFELGKIFELEDEVEELKDKRTRLENQVEELQQQLQQLKSGLKSLVEKIRA